MMDRQGFGELSRVPAARENGGLSLVHSARGRLRHGRLCAEALPVAAAGLCVSFPELDFIAILIAFVITELIPPTYLL